MKQLMKKRIFPILILSLMLLGIVFNNSLFIQKTYGASFDTVATTETEDPAETAPVEPQPEPEPVPVPTPEPEPVITPDPVVTDPVVTPEPASPVAPTTADVTDNTSSSTNTDTTSTPTTSTTNNNTPSSTITNIIEPPAVVATVSTSIEGSTLIGTLLDESISYSSNDNFLVGKVNSDSVIAAIATLKAQKSENKSIEDIILRFPKSTVVNLSGIQLVISGSLVNQLNQEGITIEYFQDSNTIKLVPDTFKTDTYKLLEGNRYVYISFSNSAQALPSDLVLYDKPATALSSLFTVKTAIGDDNSATEDITLMNKGINLSTTLSDVSRQNIASSAVVSACSFSADNKMLTTIQTQYDSKSGTASYSIISSGNYILVSRAVSMGESINNWLLIIAIVLLVLLIFIIGFIKHKRNILSKLNPPIDPTFQAKTLKTKKGIPANIDDSDWVFSEETLLDSKSEIGTPDKQLEWISQDELQLDSDDPTVPLDEIQWISSGDTPLISEAPLDEIQWISSEDVPLTSEAPLDETLWVSSKAEPQDKIQKKDKPKEFIPIDLSQIKGPFDPEKI